MVLPVQALPGGKAGGKKKVGQVGKGGKVILPPNDIQVNLIVDPDALKGREEEEEDDDDDTGWDGSLPSTRRKKKPRRRSVFAGLAMEEDWKRARKWAQKLAVFDAVSMVLWGATFVYILIGKRCPSGGFDGWYVCIHCIAFPIFTVWMPGVTRTTYPLPLHVCSVLPLVSVSSSMSRIYTVAGRRLELAHDQL